MSYILGTQNDGWFSFTVVRYSLEVLVHKLTFLFLWGAGSIYSIKQAVGTSFYEILVSELD